MKPLATLLALAALSLAACSALGDAQDHRVDPGGSYRPLPDPAQAR